MDVLRLFRDFFPQVARDAALSHQRMMLASYHRRRGASKGLLVAGLLVTVAIGIAGYLWWVAPRDDAASDGNEAGNGDQVVEQEEATQSKVVTREHYETAVQAVSATEEAKFEQAVDLWDKLSQADPSNPTYKLNLAVTVLKWIDEVNGALNSGKLTPEQQQQMQVELQSAYNLVETAVAALESANTSDYRASFVKAALLEVRAGQSPDQSTELLRRAADTISAQLTTPEAQIPPTGYLLLAVKFDELASQLEPEYPELQRQNADFLLVATRKQSRNMFLLKRAAEVMMSNEDPRLKDLLEAAFELPKPMMSAPGIARNVERLQPEALKLATSEAIEAGNWSQVRRLQAWLNTTMSMSGFRSDSRLAKPDVLALLETQFLFQLSQQLTTSDSLRSESLPGNGVQEIVYTVQELPYSASAITWYDFNADFAMDAVIASNNELLFVALENGQLADSPAQRLDVGFPVTGILPVDLFEVDYPGRPLLPKSVAELMLRETAPPATNDQSASTPSIAADRHDTLQELVVWGEAGIRILTRVGDATEYGAVSESTGLENVSSVQQVVALDIESDGDLDLAILSADGLLLMQNRGNRTFEDISQFSNFPASATAMVAADIDRDTDQDLLLARADEPTLQVFENILHGQFRSSAFPTEQNQSKTPLRALAVADFDANGSWDMVGSGERQSLLLLTNLLDDQSLSVRERINCELGGACLAVADLNNDGIEEILAGGATGIQVLTGMHREKLGFGIAAQATQLVLEGKSVTALELADANRNGALELLAIADGKAVLCQPQAVTGDYSLVRVAGINDGNGGGRVNHYGIGSALEIATGDRILSRIVDSPSTHFGLGDLEPKNLRIIFPNGLTQNAQPIESNMLIEEKQVLRGSCPYVYGWNGERFELITDLLWNAPLGLQISRGQTLPDRRWENLLLPGDLVKPRDDGRIELRVTEELWEVAYFDHIELTAIDHPRDVRVFTNEKVGPASMAEHRVFAVTEQLRPHAARDSHGRDITDQINTLDGSFVQAFDHLICQGLAEPHYVELDFGPLPIDEHELHLFMTGWMYPTDTSLNIGIDQNPERSPPEPPSLWVVDESGSWVCAQPFMGFPGGKTKSIAIPLKDVFRSSDHRLRIGSSQQLYWDEAIIGWHAGDDLVKSHRLTIDAAKLRYRGFSELLPRQTDHPHWFDYQAVTTTPQWPRLEGPFTRFGDVTSLLSEDDDQMVVMVSGDEIALEFAFVDPQAQQLANDWSRDFVMHSTGWDKDADLNTLAGQGSLPLPFMDQTAYPAPLEQAAEVEAVWRKNADTLKRFQPSRGEDSSSSSVNH